MGATKRVRVQDGDTLLSSSECARRLRCSSEWVRRLTARGDLPSVSTNLGRLVPRSALREFVQAKRAAKNGADAE